MVASKAAGQEDRDRSVSVTVTDREYEAAVIESLKDRADKPSDAVKEVSDFNHFSAIVPPLYCMTLDHFMPYLTSQYENK